MNRRIPARTTAQRPVPVPQPDLEEDERYYRPTQVPRSARRYVNTEGHEVIERGNQRLVIHRQPPPRKHHWLLFAGAGMMAALVLVLVCSWIGSAWQAHQVDAMYGYPRTSQVDAVVGHDDSAAHPSHFIFLNLHAQVIIVELPGGNIQHTLIYSGPTLFGPDADKDPVTGDFRDVNGDGKLDMVVHIQGQTLIFLNNGSKFVPQG